MTRSEFDDWWLNAISKAKNSNLNFFADHPNYEAWVQALGNMHTRQRQPNRNETKTFCNELIIVHGVDPEHIVAVFTLLFL